MEPSTEHCMICGSSLEYLSTTQTLTCTYCGKVEQGYVKCPQGHYVCDSCHNKGSLKAIEEIAYSTKSKDPVEISELMMSLPGLPMLGCQHAYIAAGALMAAIRNQGPRPVTNDDIREAFGRVEKQAIGGYCGLTGVCGVSPAVGAAVSVLIDARCGTDIEQRITMDAVVEASNAIAKLTGPSCCKAYVRASLQAVRAIIKDDLGIDLSFSKLPANCAYVDIHPHGCRREKCDYYASELS